MKHRYYITSAQTTIAPHDPGFATIKEARAELSDIIKEETAACRRRFKTAFKHRTGDCVEITIGEDRRSAMWNRFAIVSF